MRDLIKICSGKPRRKLPEEGNQPCERRSVARVPPSPPGGPISPSLSLSFPPPPRNPIFPTSHPLPSCPPGGGVGGACLTGSFSGSSRSRRFGRRRRPGPHRQQRILSKFADFPYKVRGGKTLFHHHNPVDQLPPVFGLQNLDRAF
ncbi:hypothetical protein VPH35_117695 [Triticum aestivum]